MLSLSQQLNLSIILKLNSDPRRQKTLMEDLVQQIRLKLQYSAVQAFGGTEVCYKEKILQIKQGLLTTASTEEDKATTSFISAYRVTTESEAEHRRRQAQLQFQALLISDRSKLLYQINHVLFAVHPHRNSRRIAARAIIEMLTHTPLDRLSLSNFNEVLTENLLIKILSASGRQLYYLNISHCLSLTERIIHVIEAKCLQLRTLRANHMRWEVVTIQGLLNMKRLDLSHAQRLRTITLIELPRLESLFVNDCSKLTSLVDEYSNLIQRTSITFQLKQINLARCTALTEMKLVAVDEIKSYFNKCNPQGLIDWLEWQDPKGETSPSPLFKLAKIALDQKAGVLDFSKIELNTSNFQLLCRLIKMNIPFKKIILSKLNYSPIAPSRFPRFDFKSSNHKNSDKSNNQDEDYDYRFQFLLVGRCRVGKSSILRRYVDDTYDSNFYPSIGIDFKIKKNRLDEEKCKLRIWDTPGLEMFRWITKHYYKGAHVIIFCWDGNGDYEESRNNVEFYIEDVERYGDENYVKILAHTKCDTENSTEDYCEKVKKYAEIKGFAYFKCSAKKNFGLHEMFEYACREVIKFPNTIRERMIMKKINEIISMLFDALKLNKTLKYLDLNEIPLTEHIKKKLIEMLKINHSLVSINFYRNKNTDSLMKEINTLLSHNKKFNQETKLQYELSTTIINSQFVSSRKNSIREIYSIAPIMDTSHFSDFKLEQENKSFIPLERPPILEEPLMIDSISSEKIQDMKSSSVQDASFLSLATSFIEIKTLDSKSFCRAVACMPDTPIDSPIQPYRQYLYQLRDRFMHSDSTAMQEMNEFLRYWCLISQYQQRLINPISEDVLAQEIIQSHLALKEYHDLLLQTLEFGIKAAMLGVTGRLKMTGSADSLISGAGTVLGVIPMIGNSLQSLTSGLALANQIKMLHTDHFINQLFLGARDVEDKIAQLAMQMTLSIRSELLENKPTPARREVLEKSSVINYYHRAKAFFSQQKVKWVNWQSLNPAQQLALWDADYLLSQIPAMVKTSRYRETTACVSAFLAILMRDPQFKFDRQIISEPQKSRTSSTFSQKRYSEYIYKRQICLQELKATAQQPLTEKPQWQNLFDCLGRLEVANLECLACQKEDESPEDLSSLLAQWFDQLLPSSSTEPRLSELVESGYALLSPSPTMTSPPSKLTPTLVSLG